MADNHVIAKLPLVAFGIINLTRLTACICMKVGFLFLAALQHVFAASQLSPLKKNLWDQGTGAWLICRNI